MSQETFLSYQRFFWARLIALAMVVLTCVYIWDNPVGGRSGGTVLGYTYGGLSTLAILILMWFGVRKRSYHSTAGTVKGWLHVHVWLGIALILLVPLHSGFSFGWNVHTLAYLLMLLTIFSGILGAVMYIELAPDVLSHRGGRDTTALLDELERVENGLPRLVNGKSEKFLALVKALDFRYKPGILRALSAASPPRPSSAEVAQLVGALPAHETGDALEAVKLIDAKVAACTSLDNEIRVKTLLKAWLYFHVPVAFGLVACLAIHILSVFVYW